MRASVHGDVVHSRPVAVNYGGDDYLGTNASVADAQVVVYYSGNDGMLRAINGNRSANIGSVYAGPGNLVLRPAGILGLHQAYL